MITRNDFAKIDFEVKISIQRTLEDLKLKAPDNYVLFLADGEYDKELDNKKVPFSPFIIDNRIDRYKDESRLKFLSNFLSTYYSFPIVQLKTDDNEQRMHMELMIYTHIWESKPFLKKLYRLAHLSSGEEYQWNVVIKDMGKHDFIRNDIRKTFEDINNPIAAIIRKGFHTSLRNAFAHSEYTFDTLNNNNRIWLDNYGGNEDWELQEISFDDWSKRFLYSALLSYYLLFIAHNNRLSLEQDFGTNTFPIKHFSSQKVESYVNIVYRKEYDSFHFAN